MRIIDAQLYLSELQTLIANGNTVYLNVSGNSMAPFLIHQRDCVCLTRPVCPLKPGDLVFYKRNTGQYVLHRICKIRKNNYYLAGDNQTILEGPIQSDQIFAVVTAVCRKGQWLSKKHFQWQFFADFWRYLFLLRPMLLFIYTEYLFIKQRIAR